MKKDIYKNYSELFVKYNFIAFGELNLTYGSKAKVFVDFYPLLSRPDLLALFSELLAELIVEEGIKFDCICGMAYGALPFVSALCGILQVPLVIRQKEKQLSDEKAITPPLFGRKCLVVEDVIGSGRTTLEGIRDLKNAGYRIEYVTAVIDRSQDGVKNLKRLNYTVLPLFDFMTIVENVYNSGLLSKEKYDICVEDCNCKFSVNGVYTHLQEWKLMSYKDRSKFCKNKAAVKLMLNMYKKQTKACVEILSIDIEEIIRKVTLLKDEICLLIIHSNLLRSLNEDGMKTLKRCCEQGDVMLLDNSKFNSAIELETLRDSYVFELVDFIAVNGFWGPEMMKATKSLMMSTPDKGAFIITDTDEKYGPLAKGYVNDAMKFAEEHCEFIAGVISLSNYVSSLQLIHITSNGYDIGFHNALEDYGADINTIVIKNT